MNITGYLLVNLYIGLGIAADVYAVTLALFRKFEEDDYLRKWIWRNTITHTVFPFIGMYAVVVGITQWRFLRSMLFGFGAVLLAYFLWHVLQEKVHGDLSNIEKAADSHMEKIKTKLSELAAHKKPRTGLARLAAKIIERIDKIDPQWWLVLAVSIDAIYSGFAKAADTQHWPAVALVISFPLVGCVVGLGAWFGGWQTKRFLSLIGKQSGANVAARARRLTKMQLMLPTWLFPASSPQKPAQRLAKMQFIALLIELLVLGYFFWRSIASALSPIIVNEWLERRIVAWAASTVSLIAALAIYGRDIIRNIDKNALQSLAEKEKA